MKTILYNPIFINPQAYYVFPRLTRWLRPDDSYKEPANYIGQIEVTIIAYGEIGYTEYFEHTNYIDFTNFSNSYVRISLFTRLGACVLGEWKIGTMEGDRPYIEPEVLASLKAVVIVGDKTNQDKDRDIVANLVDASNPFVISNAAYKLNSGYGKYEVDFTTWSKRNVVTSNNDNSFSFESKVSSSLLYYSTTIGVDTPSFKIKANISNCLVYYYYINDKGTLSSISILESGEFELPISHNTLYNGNIGIGFEIGRINGTGTGTITQIPSYQGAFVTDGVNDLITSTKTVQEMGITDEITVVSMIGQLSTPNVNNYTNTIRNQPSTTGSYNKVEVSAIDKTGIYGYSFNSSLKCSIINDILGDKQDYSVSLTTQVENISAKYLVQGWIDINGLAVELSSVAWYWTIIANKVLTTDQINQVIAYYNLDRCVEPTVLYDVKRQGLSNDTPDSDWYLKDFSKNGFDMSLFNFAKKGNSGVGKYETDFLDSSIWKYKTNSSVTSDKIVCNKAATHIMLLYYSITDENKYDVPSFNVLKQGDASEYYYIDEQGTRRTFKLLDGINTLPASHGTLFTGTEATCGFGNPGIGNSVTITQIPSHAGALCFDGVNDYGKVTGLPIYKDYTVVADYERFNIGNIEGIGTPPVLSKSYTAGQGSFIMNFIASTGNSIHSYSFGAENTRNFSDLARQIFYQSKYKSQGFDITAGTGIDGDSLWLGTARDNDSRFFNGAIYSLMTFPYSMSEFLIERQLKKHKLGTLYPDMVEWRPIYTSNVNDYTITKATYFDETGQHDLALGNHYPIGTRFRIYVKPSGAVDEVTSIKVNGVELTYNYIDSNYGYAFNGTLSSKSPQKIDITIDEYIRYEDIVQPYPAVVKLKINERLITWGDKLKVGDEFIYDNNINLLPNMYNISATLIYNGNELHASHKAVVAKTMSFKPYTVVPLLANMPKCILSPQTLKIPNSSYRILGYIPDISGHGNHGKINNSAYAEGSGVNADGSYQLDGVDDFITIPTTVGGKQVLMKVNWQSSIGQGMLYDQRGTAFAIWNSDKYNDDETDTIPAYSARNGGNTYIDGILNKNILASQLRNITHNIVATNTMLNGSSVSPTIGCRTEHDAYFTSMSLYDFMLFDEISTDEEILTLNEYVGIEGNTDDLFN